MTRRAAGLAKVLIATGLLLAVAAVQAQRLNGAFFLAELIIWGGVWVVLRGGRSRYVSRYGTGPKARAQARREQR